MKRSDTAPTAEDESIRAQIIKAPDDYFDFVRRPAKKAKKHETEDRRTAGCQFLAWNSARPRARRSGTIFNPALQFDRPLRRGLECGCEPAP